MLSKYEEKSTDLNLKYLTKHIMSIEGLRKKVVQVTFPKLVEKWEYIFI